MKFDVILNRTDFLNFKVDKAEDDTALIVSSSLQPSTIDSNFNELETRIVKLEQQNDLLITTLNNLLRLNNMELI